MASYSIHRENQKFQKDHGSQFKHSFGKECLKSISFQTHFICDVLTFCSQMRTKQHLLSRVITPDSPLSYIPSILSFFYFSLFNESLTLYLYSFVQSLYFYCTFRPSFSVSLLIDFRRMLTSLILLFNDDTFILVHISNLELIFQIFQN